VIGWLMGAVVSGGAAGGLTPITAVDSKAPATQRRWDLQTTAGWMKMLDDADVATKRKILSGYGGSSGSSLDHMNSPMRRAMRQEQDPVVRAYAAGFLIRQYRLSGPEQDEIVHEAAGVLAGALQNPDARRIAIYNLQHSGNAVAPALPGLVKLVTTVEDEELLQLLVSAFKTLGASAAPAARDLSDLLTHDKWKVRFVAAKLLGHVGPEASAALPALVARLEDDNRDVTVAANGAIRKIDATALPNQNPVKRLLPEYIRMLEGGDLREGMQAIVALDSIGPDGAEALPALLGFLNQHGDSQEVEQGGLFIGGVVLGMREAAVPELLKVMKSRDKAMRSGAVMFLANLSQFVPESRVPLADAVPDLIEGLRDEEPSVREGAAGVLDDLGAAGKPAVPQLLKTLDVDDLRTTASVVEALARIDPDVLPKAPQVRHLVERLVKKLENNTEEDDYLLTRTLLYLRQAALPAVPAMLRAAVLRAEGDLPETSYLTAIKKVGPAAVPVLTAALDDPNPKIRLAAVMALEDIKPRELAARAALEKAAADTDPSVSRWAGGALRRADASPKGVQQPCP
jgi:HEAT repeat protein